MDSIPVRATIISSVLTLSFFTGFSVFLALDNCLPLLILVAIHNLIPLPLTLVFCVKHTKSTNVQSQPPQGLHSLHEDFEKNEEIEKAEPPKGQ